MLGFIAGAMGGAANAAGQIADKQIETNQRSELARLESQLQQEREVARQRLAQTIGREDSLYNTTGEGGQAKLQYEVDRTKQTGAAETDVLVGRETAMGPVRATNARLETVERGTGERTNLAAYAGDPAARKGVQAKADDSESTSTKAARAVSTQGGVIDNQMRAAERDLRAKISAAREAGNEAEAQRLERQLGDRFGRGGATGGRPGSMSDVMAGARLLEARAKEIEFDDPDEAKRLRDEATALVRGVASAKGVGGAAPAPAKAGPPVGTVDSGYRFKGGDPKDPKNWEQVK